MTWIIGEDGVVTMTFTYEGGTDATNGTWSATGNKLTIMENAYTTVYDYSISGNMLTIEMDYVEEGETETAVLKFQKQ